MPPSLRSSAGLSLPPLAPSPPPAMPKPRDSNSRWNVPLEQRSSGPIPPIAAEAPEPADSAPSETTGKPSFLGRVFDKLAFWRPARDAVACSVLAPPVLLVGEPVVLPLFAHCEAPETILAMGRTYFPAHELV